MRRRPSVIAIVITFIVALSTATVSSAVAETPSDTSGAQATSYFVTKYDSTVWAVTASSVSALTFAQWQSAGAPTPAPAPTEYVKYAWSPAISAVTLFGTDQSRWVWKHLSGAEWAKAGAPKPRTAGWIDGSSYYQWAGSSQIFVEDVSGVKHAMTYSEWSASGFQTYTKQSNQGFVKLTWNPSIAYLTDYSGGKGSAITGAQWKAQGYPTPVMKSRVAGDQVYQNYGSTQLYYAGPNVSKAISYAEWKAMGFPTPSVRGLPAVSSTAASNAASVLSLTNQQRASNGLGALRADTQLNNAAQAWAQQLASSCTFEHSTPAWRAARTTSWAATGENIAAGYATSSDVVVAWMNSPGHRANILDGRYTGLGVGYATGPCYGTYWVQIFGIAK